MFVNSTRNQVHHISFSRLFQANVSMLFQAKGCQHSSCQRNTSISILRLMDAEINRGVCPQKSVIAQHLLSIDWIRLWITCAEMTTHSCWSARNNSLTFAGAFTLPRTRLSNSSQMFSIECKLIWGHWRAGENLDDVVSEELHDLACCIKSDVFVLKYSAIQRLTPEIKQQKNMRFYVWTVYIIVESFFCVVCTSAYRYACMHERTHVHTQARTHG